MVLRKQKAVKVVFMKMIMKVAKGWSLVALDPQTRDALDSLPIGKEVMVEVKARRNLKFHRKLFALLSLILENQDYYKTIELLLDEVKFRAGYFEINVTHKGQTIAKPKSISFASMDEIEFAEFYKHAVDVGFELCGSEEMEKEVLNFI